MNRRPQHHFPLFLIAVVRGKGFDDTVKMVENIIEGGIKNIEITYTTPKASELIEHFAAMKSGVNALHRNRTRSDSTSRWSLKNPSKTSHQPQGHDRLQQHPRLTEQLVEISFHGIVTVLHCI